MAGALIIAAEIGQPELGWLEGLRRAHYPRERNQLSAHLTMFHALPPSVESEAQSRLKALAKEPRPIAKIDGLMDLGGGVAFRIVSPDLESIRRELAEDFRGLLSAQDSGGWRPHVTIQNKVAPKVARTLKQALESDFRSQSLLISGLGLYRYLDGPWERIGIYPFRG